MKHFSTMLSAPLMCMILNVQAASLTDEVRFLRFPARDGLALGQIEKLTVTVSCSRVTSLRDVPELYQVEMSYDIPAEHVFKATPRLGAAAVGISRWSGVIGIHIPQDSDAKSCFKVTAVAEGRAGSSRTWIGPQLGLHP